MEYKTASVFLIMYPQMCSPIYFTILFLQYVNKLEFMNEALRKFIKKFSVKHSWRHSFIYVCTQHTPFDCDRYKSSMRSYFSIRFYVLSRSNLLTFPPRPRPRRDSFLTIEPSDEYKICGKKTTNYIVSNSYNMLWSYNMSVIIQK